MSHLWFNHRLISDQHFARRASFAMPLVYASIAPHGGEIIPELVSKSLFRKFGETREAMRSLAKRISESRPQTIVIASPHNLRLRSRIPVVVPETSTGTWKGSSNQTSSLDARCEHAFA